MLSVPAQDYWWYLRLGKDILEQGAIPLVDTMGYSRAGEPIFYQQWLSGIIFFLVYQAGNAPLTFLLRAWLIGITYSSIWYMMRSYVGARTATILLIILGMATSSNWICLLYTSCRWVGVQSVFTSDLFEHDLDLIEEVIQSFHTFGEAITKQTQLRSSGLPELEMVTAYYSGR